MSGAAGGSRGNQIELQFGTWCMQLLQYYLHHIQATHTCAMYICTVRACVQVLRVSVAFRQLLHNNTVLGSLLLLLLISKWANNAQHFAHHQHNSNNSAISRLTLVRVCVCGGRSFAFINATTFGEAVSILVCNICHIFCYWLCIASRVMCWRTHSILFCSIIFVLKTFYVISIGF